MIKNILNEDSRQQLISKAKKGKNYKDQSKGKNRYERRLKSVISNSTKEYNEIDMTKLFTKGILDINVPVHGETDDYIVKISFGRFLDILQRYVTNNNDDFALRFVIKALIEAFNQDNVYIHCTCDDWRFRMAFWATKNDINSGEK